MAAYDAGKFLAIHDEIFENFRQARRNEEWRAGLAPRFGVEAALTDSATIALIDRMIQTGREYAKTHEQYAHGIRSTPTMIVNNRMIIGTLPYEQLRAIFQALVDEHEGGERRFIESWIEP
jgi:protein-disulfide isomerase